MSELYPDAPVVCLWNDSVGRFAEARVEETWLARTPLRHRKALALPLMPFSWRMLRDRNYDWALISSHAFAHHANFRGAEPGFRKLVYVHTPARYVWAPHLDGRGARLGARIGSQVLRPMDRYRARQGAHFAANSHYVRRRINETWGVDAQVIYPPVRVERIQAVADWSALLGLEERSVLESLPDGFVLGASRFVPYKRLDLVLAVGEATGRPVVLAGAGPQRLELELLARQASVPVYFVDRPSDPLLYSLFQRTAVYVFPALEDFGIMPVEAMAAGAPVLARSEGGAAESTVAGHTGALIDFSSPEQMRRGVEEAMATRLEDRLLRARQFGETRFGREIHDWVTG